VGVAPALPGRQSNFENSGSHLPAFAFTFAKLMAKRILPFCSFGFFQVANTPQKGYNRKPPTLQEDRYFVYDGRGGGIRTPDPLLPKQVRSIIEAH
jgi:hypothetical protein